MKYWLFLFLSLWVGVSLAQNSPASETELRKQADKHFLNNQFFQACPMYSQLLSLNPQDALLNYRYGASLIEAGKEKTAAIPFLEFASKQAGIPEESWLYLGRAYMMNNNFSKASEVLSKYKSIAVPAKARKMEVDLLITNCNNASTVIKERKDIAIQSSQTMKRANFYSAYDYTETSGKLVPTAEQFLTTQDKDKQLNPLMFISKDGQLVYYSSYGRGGASGKDIYMIRKMANGQWGVPENLGMVLNSTEHEDYPYMDRDGRTLYFCSRGHSSIGGFDVFKSVFDYNTGQWSVPENLGIPINSAADDFFYVPTLKGDFATYSTTYDSEYGDVQVKKISNESINNRFAVISGVYFSLDQATRRDARITVLRTSDKAVVNSVRTDPKSGKYELVLPPGQDYMLVVEGGSYLAHAEEFSLPDLAVAGMRQEVKLNKDKEKEQMTVSNFFTPINATSDEPVMAFLETPTDVSTSSIHNLGQDSAQMVAIKVADKIIYVNDPNKNDDKVEELIAVEAKSVANYGFQDGAKATDPGFYYSEEADTTADGLPSIRLEEKDRYDPTLAQKLSDDELRQIEEEKERSQIVIEEEKNPSILIDFNIDNDELAKIALDDAKLLQEEAERMKETAYAMQANAQLQDSLSISLNDEAESMDDSDPERKRELRNRSVELKDESTTLNREASDLLLQASIKFEESRAAKRDADAILRSSRSSEQLASDSQSKSDKMVGNTEKEEAANTKSITDQKQEDNTSTTENIAENTLTDTELKETKSETNNETQTDVVEIAGIEEKKSTASESELTEKQESTLQSKDKKKVEDSKTNPPGTATTIAVIPAGKNSNNEKQVTQKVTQESNSNAEEIPDSKSETNTSTNDIASNQDAISPEIVSAEEISNSKNESNPSTKELATQDELSPSINETASQEDSTIQQNLASLPDEKSVETNDVKETEPASSIAVITTTTIDENPADGNLKTDSKKTIPATDSETMLNESSESTSVDPSKNEISNQDGALSRTEEVKQEQKVKEVSENSDEQNLSSGSVVKEVLPESKEITTEQEKEMKSEQNVAQNDSKNKDDEVISEKAGVSNSPVESLTTTTVDPTSANRAISENPISQEVKVESTLQATESSVAFSDSIGIAVREVNSASSAELKKSEKIESEGVVSKENESLATNSVPVAPSEKSTLNTESTAGQNSTDLNSKISIAAPSTVNQNATPENKIVPVSKSQSSTPTRELYVLNETQRESLQPDAKVVYESYEKNVQVSETLLKQSRTLQNRILEMPRSPERDSLVQVSNSLSRESSQQYAVAQKQLNQANTIDPRLSGLLSEAEIQVSSVQPSQASTANVKQENSPAVPTIAENTNRQNTNPEIPTQTGSTTEISTEVWDQSESLVTSDTKTKPEADVIEESQKESIPSSEKSLESASAKVKNEEKPANPSTALSSEKSTIANDSETELIAMKSTQSKTENDNASATKPVATVPSNASQDSEGLNLNHPKYPEYKEVQSQITEKQVETINLFAEGVNLNRIAVEEKQQQVDLMDRAQNESDEVKRTALLKEAEDLKVRSVKNEELSREKFSASQARTGDVKSLSAQSESLRNEIKQSDMTTQNSESIAGNTQSDKLAQRGTSSTNPSAVSSTEQINDQTLAYVDKKAAPAKLSAMLAPVEIEKMSVEMYSKGQGPVYSKVNPIPLNPGLPEGLVFKVQIGAFRKPIADDSFKNLQPVSGETTRPGWIRYCVGMFKTFEPANLVKKELRKGRYKDAFVVVYYNGTRISLAEAKTILNRQENQLAYAGEMQKEITALQQMEVIPAKINYGVKDNDERMFYADATRPVIRNLEDLVPLEYSVQVGVYRNETPPIILSSLDPIYTEAINKGLYRFTYGRFVNRSDAEAAKTTAVQTGVSDAFIVAFKGNKKVAAAPITTQASTTPTTQAAIPTLASVPEKKTETVASINSEIHFKVQLGAFRQNVPFELVEAFLKISDKGIIRVTDERGLNIFYAGDYLNYESARLLKEEIVTKGVKDAFVVAISGGKRVPLSTVLPQIE